MDENADQPRCDMVAEAVKAEGTLILQSGRDSTIVAGGVHAGGSVSIGGEDHSVHHIQNNYPPQTIRRNSFLKKYKAGEGSLSWGIPFETVRFIERPALFEKLSSFHQKPGAISACTGMGGMGKTQLTLNYLRKAPYGLKVWLSAENPALLEQSYLDFARTMGFEEERPTRAQTMAYVQDKLALRQDWLLVFDNAEGFDAIREFLPSGGQVIITTRHQKWPATIQLLEVESMTSAEALSLLESTSARPLESQSETLAKTLGYLPLAIAQAGAYLKENGMNSAQYLDLYQKHASQLLQDNSLGTTSVFITLDLSLQQLKVQTNDAAEKVSLELLRVCAYLHADQIPQILLFTWCHRAYPQLSELDFNKSLNRLAHLSLIKKEPQNKSLSIHRLVQTLLRDQHQMEGGFTAAWYVPLAWALHDDFNSEKGLLEDETHRKYLLPHLRKLTDYYRLIKVVDENSEKAQSHLLFNRGCVHDDLGHYQEAKSCYESTLRIQEQVYGAEDAETVARTLNNLGAVHGALGDIAQQKVLLERALSIEEHHYGKDHPEVAVTLSNLGIAYGALGDAMQQKALLERAWVIQEHHYGKNHPEVAVMLTNFGNACGALGDAMQQKALLERALVIQEHYYGKDHPQVAVTLTNLGNAHGALGDAARQKALLERALVIKEHYYGQDHPEVAITLVNLGIAHGDLGDAVREKALLERALVIKEHHYGKDHLRVATTLVNLGIAYGALGDAVQGKALLERALVIRERYYGQDHPGVAVTLTNLGNAYGALRDAMQQKALLERALVIQEHYYGQDHPEVATTLGNLGNAYGALGNAVQQKALLERALVIQEHYYGQDHPEVATTLGNLGIAYGALGDVVQKKALLERALVIKEHYYGPEHVRVAKTLFNLGQSYKQLGELKKALEFLEQSLKINVAYYGGNHESVKTNLRSLNNIYVSLNPGAEGQELLDKALKLRVECFGPDDANAQALTRMGARPLELSHVQSSYASVLGTTLFLRNHICLTLNNKAKEICRRFNNCLRRQVEQHGPQKYQ